MKTAFNIMPAGNDDQPAHLLVEAGIYGISFAWFTKEPKAITGLAVYNFTNKISLEAMEDELRNVLKSNSIFNEQHITATICFDFKESLLVPKAYYRQSTARQMLDLIFIDDGKSDIRTDEIPGMDMYNVYAVQQKIETVLSNKFYGAEIHHSTSVQLPKINAIGKQLYCTVFHNSIKIFLFNEGLLFTKHFCYDTPVDAVYHLLNCCEQYDILPGDLWLMLNGMIEEKSNLFNEFHKYFLNIEFVDSSPEFAVNSRISFYPAHFFSHLTELVSCVS